MRKIAFFALTILGFIAIYSYFYPQSRLVTTTKETLKTTDTPTEPKIGVIADKLQVPWSLVFLPDGSILFTERPGRVRIISSGGTLQESSVATIKDVKTIGEGGLLGVEVHPDFAKNHYVYLYYTYAGDSNRTLNKVVRYVYDNNRLSGEKILVTDIPGNSNHNGGRMKFGPDGFLYIATGDSQDPSLSQDKNSLAGKILRVTDDGKPAPGNPFSNFTYSYGHRNPQGLAWDDQEMLWSTEHGPSAGDELNLIEAGKNYGWPIITKSKTQSGLVTPVINSENDTWAPAGIAFIKPYLYFAGLRSNTLYRYNIEIKELNRYLQKEYGRLRDVVLGPDGMLYVTTSNMDGRALTHLDGDKIIRLDPQNLK